MSIQRNISSEVGSLSCKSSLKSNKWCWTLKIIWMPINWSQVKWSPFCGCWCQKWQHEKQIAETSERKGGRVLPPEAGDWADRVRERAYHCHVQTGRARRTDRHALLKPAHISSWPILGVSIKNRIWCGVYLYVHDLIPFLLSWMSLLFFYTCFRKGRLTSRRTWVVSEAWPLLLSNFQDKVRITRRTWEDRWPVALWKC